MAINQGLLALGNVIRVLAMAEDQRRQHERLLKEMAARGGTPAGLPQRNLPAPPAPNHIPYRASKLTRLLQDTLSTYTRTFLIACVSQDPDNADETIRTLQYSAKAMRIIQAPRAVPSSPLSLRAVPNTTNRTSPQPGSLCYRCGGQPTPAPDVEESGDVAFHRKYLDQLQMTEEQEEEIQLLQAVKDNLEHQLKDTKRLLEDERVHYDSLLETLESEKTATEGRLREKERTTARLETTLNELKAELSQDEGVFATLTESLHTSKRENKKLEEVIRVLRSEVLEAKGARASLEAKIEKLNARLSVLDAEKQKLKTEAARAKIAKTVASREVATSTTSLHPTSVVSFPPPPALPQSGRTTNTNVSNGKMYSARSISPDSAPLGCMLSPSPLTVSEDDYHNSSHNLALQTLVLVRQLEDTDEVRSPLSFPPSEVGDELPPQPHSKSHELRRETSHVSPSKARHMYSGAYYMEHPTRSPVANRDQLICLGHTADSNGSSARNAGPAIPQINIPNYLRESTVARALFNDGSEQEAAYHDPSNLASSSSDGFVGHDRHAPPAYAFQTSRSNRQEVVSYPSLRPSVGGGSSCTAAPLVTAGPPRPSTTGGASSRPRTTTKVQLFNSTSTLGKSLESEFTDLQRKPGDSLRSQPPAQPTAPCEVRRGRDAVTTRPPLRPLPTSKVNKPFAIAPRAPPLIPTSQLPRAPQPLSTQPRKGGDTLADYIKKWDVENVSSFGGMEGFGNSLSKSASSSHFSVHFEHEKRDHTNSQAAGLWGNPFQREEVRGSKPTERTSAELAEENKALRQQLAAIQMQLF